MTNYANIRYQPAAASTTTVADIAALIALTGMSNGDQALVQATNKLYMYSGTGWYIIATIQNDAPSAITGVSGTYELAIDGTAAVITAASTDPEGFPLTWSYSTSGLGSIATISNTDNVFTITPSTTEADAGAFTLTINATDGINGAVSTTTNLTLEFIVTVTNSKYTTLLATATGTSDNNNITDTSTNNHSITVNGDTHAGTFSPYRSGGYSTSFSRSNSSNLEIASMPAIGSGDCSIEFWCKIDSQAWNGIISRGAYNSSGTFSLSSRSGDTELTLIWSGTIYTTSGANIDVDQWKWVQIIRSSGTVTIYVNGSSVGSWSNSSNVSSTSNYIIGRVDSSDYFGGCLRDLRISTNAQSALNRSEKLATDSNTTFLSCHLPYLSYSTSSVASNSYSSISGTIKTAPLSPYDNEEYSVTDHGGSVYFDGTDDYLRVGSNKDILNGLINNDNLMTIESWVYPTISRSGALSYTSPSILSIGNTYLSIGLESLTPFFYWWTGSGNKISSSNAVTLNAWSHIAVVLDANSGTNNIKIYINGTLDGQGTFSGISWASGAEGDQVKIGNGNSANTDAYFQGYIQDFRITVGSANYTSNFTPTTAPLSSSGAALHIKGTDASIIDKSQGANLELVNTTGSTTQVKFANTKSIYTGGNSSATIRLDASNKLYDLSYGEGDFTVEGWFYTTDNTNNPKLYIDISSASAYWQLYYISGSGITLRANNTGIYSIETGNSFTENTWHHIALCRSGSNYKVFHNGTEIINVNSTHQIGSNSTKTIGGTDISTGNNLRGYIQDFRITKGLARYTASFTPPTEPLKG